MAEPLRVAFLCAGTREFASTRLRVLQYLPHLERLGWRCRVIALQGAAATARDQRDLEAGAGRTAAALADKLIRPLRWLDLPRRLAGCDLLFVQRALGPRFLQARAAAAVRACVLDLDDGIHQAHPDLGESRGRVAKRRARLEHWLHTAKAVTVASPLLAEEFPAAPCHLLPTPVDCDRVRPAGARPAGPVVVGWIGSPPNAPALELVREPLERLMRRRPGIELLLVGGGSLALAGVPARRHRWSEAEELDALARMDIGLMPLPDGPWNRFKGGYKLLLYMAAGLPVVASPTGVNRQLVRPGQDGFLAADPASWEQALERLIADSELRAQLGGAGRARVEREFSVAALAPRLAGLLQQVAGRG